MEGKEGKDRGGRDGVKEGIKGGFRAVKGFFKDNLVNPVEKLVSQSSPPLLGPNISLRVRRAEAASSACNLARAPSW